MARHHHRYRYVDHRSLSSRCLTIPYLTPAAFRNSHTVGVAPTVTFNLKKCVASIVSIIIRSEHKDHPSCELIQHPAYTTNTSVLRSSPLHSARRSHTHNPIRTRTPSPSLPLPPTYPVHAGQQVIDWTPVYPEVATFCWLAVRLCSFHVASSFKAPLEGYLPVLPSTIFPSSTFVRVSSATFSRLQLLLPCVLRPLLLRRQL